MRFCLKSCVWEITLACSFSCTYCGSGGGKARENELSTAECLRVVRELKDLGCRRVSLIGGEIFLRKDWEQIVGALTAAGMKVCVITNGFAMTDDQIRFLKETGIESVAVSLDGTQQIHDRYRMEGSFQRALKTIFRLREQQIPVSVITTLNRENAARLPELYEILVSAGIFAWQLQACSPMGNAVRSGIDYRFRTDEVIRFVAERVQEAPFALGVADNIGYFTPEEGYIRGNRRGKVRYRGCSAGLSSLGIDSVGNVRGCESMYDARFIEGNLRERSLREIWEDPEAFAYNRRFQPALLTGACAACENSPYCAGGCRSYNFFVHGKLYEAPFCARNPQAGNGE